MNRPLMTLFIVCYALFFTQSCMDYSPTPDFQEYQVDIENDTDLPIHTVEVSINETTSHIFTSKDDFESDDSSIEITFDIPNSEEKPSTVEIICKSYGLPTTTITRTISKNRIKKSQSNSHSFTENIAFLEKHEKAMKKERISNLIDFLEDNDNQEELEEIFGSDLNQLNRLNTLGTLLAEEPNQQHQSSELFSSEEEVENEELDESGRSSQDQPTEPYSSEEVTPESSFVEDTNSSSSNPQLDLKSSSSYLSSSEEVNTYTITVNKGSNETESISINEETEIKLSIEPIAPDGYEFKEWDSGPGCSLKYETNALNTKIGCTKNEVIDAIFTPKAYTIVVSAKGTCGTVSNETLSYTMDSDNVIIETDIDEYCDPDYTSDDLELSEHIITGIQDGAFVKPVLTATVTFNEITIPQTTISITCQADNIDINCADVSDEIPSSVTIKEDDAPKSITTTAAWGFTFSTLVEESNADVSGSTIGFKKSGEGQVIAQYTRKLFTVTFNSTPSNFFSETASVKYQAPHQITAPDAPFGYEFSHWEFDDKDCTIPGATGQSITYSCYTNTMVTAEYTELINGEFPDSRDSQIYKWVRIGEQIWMAENLNYSIYDTISSFCYESRSSNCNIHGRMYYWPTAITGQKYTPYTHPVVSGVRGSNDTPSNIQGICPNNWHLPSKNEWTQLIDFAGPSGQQYILHETNTTGFSVKLGGYFITRLAWEGINTNEYWWTTSDNAPMGSQHSIYIVQLSKISISSNSLDEFLQQYVRCIKD
ncbi:MAG: hypothetical protein OCC49_05175 [Fibrobacterales bacterium]